MIHPAALLSRPLTATPPFPHSYLVACALVVLAGTRRGLHSQLLTKQQPLTPLSELLLTVTRSGAKCVRGDNRLLHGLPFSVAVSGCGDIQGLGGAACRWWWWWRLDKPAFPVLAAIADGVRKSSKRFTSPLLCGLSDCVSSFLTWPEPLPPRLQCHPASTPIPLHPLLSVRSLWRSAALSCFLQALPLLDKPSPSR